MNNIKDIVKKGNILLANKEDVFLSDRVEKITIATYMVTDLFSDEEPLRSKIRERSVELMSFVMSFRDFKKEEVFRSVILLVSEIESLLKVAFISKNISEMNYSILSQEYKKIIEIIKEKNIRDERFVLLEDFFKRENESDDEVEDSNEIYKGQTKIKDIDKGHQKSIKDTYTSTPTKIHKGQETKKERKKIARGVVKTNQIKTNRKELIIKFIKDKKEVSVKDILKVVKDCSEKTIQRDLANMVKSGVLKKEGERRWSRYSIK